MVMVGYETSHRRRHSPVVMRFDKEEVTNREWMIEFFFLRGIFHLFNSEARNIELEFME